MASQYTLSPQIGNEPNQCLSNEHVDDQVDVCLSPVPTMQVSDWMTHRLYSEGHHALELPE